ncbi:MAG: metal-dependent hydrolase [Deltaproteobacteria bacterium]|nr:metal-dependent hydrolase [Deltaproteobacteria bacterium]
MASYKGHTLVGIIAVVLFFGVLTYIFSYHLDWRDIPVFVIIGILGALFPDVDTNSRGQDIFYTIFFGLDIVLITLKRYDYAAFLGLLAILPVLGKHRGWTHTWWAMIIVPLPIIILPVFFFRAEPAHLVPYYACAVTGYFSHLLLDWKFR